MKYSRKLPSLVGYILWKYGSDKQGLTVCVLGVCVCVCGGGGCCWGKLRLGVHQLSGDGLSEHVVSIINALDRITGQEIVTSPAPPGEYPAGHLGQVLQPWVVGSLFRTRNNVSLGNDRAYSPIFGYKVTLVISPQKWLSMIGNIQPRGQVDG